MRCPAKQIAQTRRFQIIPVHVKQSVCSLRMPGPDQTVRVGLQTIAHELFLRVSVHLQTHIIRLDRLPIVSQYIVGLSDLEIDIVIHPLGLPY